MTDIDKIEIYPMPPDIVTVDFIIAPTYRGEPCQKQYVKEVLAKTEELASNIEKEIDGIIDIEVDWLDEKEAFFLIIHGTSKAVKIALSYFKERLESEARIWNPNIKVEWIYHIEKPK